MTVSEEFESGKKARRSFFFGVWGWIVLRRGYDEFWELHKISKFIYRNTPLSPDDAARSTLKLIKRPFLLFSFSFVLITLMLCLLSHLSALSEFVFPTMKNNSTKIEFKLSSLVSYFFFSSARITCESFISLRVDFGWLLCSLFCVSENFIWSENKKTNWKKNSLPLGHSFVLLDSFFFTCSLFSPLPAQNNFFCCSAVPNERSSQICPHMQKRDAEYCR